MTFNKNLLVQGIYCCKICDNTRLYGSDQVEYDSIRLYGSDQIKLVCTGFMYCTSITRRGYGGRVVTLSPPTSEAGDRSPSWP